MENKILWHWSRVWEHNRPAHGL